MLLHELIQAANLDSYVRAPLPSSEVTGICYDSRKIQAGNVFVAVPGTATDGHTYTAQAHAAGAAAIVLERPDAAPPGAIDIVVPASRVALADLAAAFYGFPARSLFVTGITGTDGKTSSSFLLSHVLEGLGRRTGLLGTVALKIGEHWEENRARQSTPEALEVQAALAAMVEAHVDDAIVEATSHGLSLQRVRRCAFDAGLVTNITSEHLEFHGTRERYIDAKALLLSALLENESKTNRPYVVINRDDEGSRSLIPRAQIPVITFGLDPGATLRAVEVSTRADGSHFTVEVDGMRFQAEVPLPGLFNVYNSLSVLALVHARGFDLQAAIEALSRFRGVPGRMHRVDQGQPFTVIIDYAHTADSLQKVLETVRVLTSKRVIAVFGSAGDRDREKRPVMGQVAAQYADFSVITDEDPRLESSSAILEAIAAGATAVGKVEGVDFIKIADRRQAIQHALGYAQPGDVVILAGKGHEQSILVGGRSLPWNEEDTARGALRSLGYDAS